MPATNCLHNVAHTHTNKTLVHFPCEIWLCRWPPGESYSCSQTHCRNHAMDCIFSSTKWLIRFHTSVVSNLFAPRILFIMSKYHSPLSKNVRLIRCILN